MSRLPQDQEATTKVYPVVLQEGSDAGIAEVGHIPQGLRRFSSSAALRLGRSSLGYGYLGKPCGKKKIARNAGWRYY